MNIYPTVKAPSGLVGTIGVRVMDPSTGQTIVVRTTSNIYEIPSVGTGVYIWEGVIPNANSGNYAVIWDTGGAAPLYFAESVGPHPVLTTPYAGLEGTLGIALVNAADNAVIVPRTTAGIIEAIPSSGVYFYTTLPSFPPGLSTYVSVWDSGGGTPQFTTDEFQVFGVAPPVVSASIPLIEGYPIAYKNVGDHRTPQEIKRLRRERMDFCRRYGEAIVLKHRYNLDDLDAGNAYNGTITGTTDPTLAKRCPACFNAVYGNTRADCPVCFGIGLVSLAIDDITNKWIENGQLVAADAGSHVQAPKYGGFGPASITWVVVPDTPLDVVKLNEAGQLTKIEVPQAVAPWYPQLGDNDLCITIEINLDEQTINDLVYRYQAHMVNPVTIRGFGRRTFQRNYQVAQQFAMNKLPKDDILYSVQVDR